MDDTFPVHIVQGVYDLSGVITRRLHRQRSHFRYPRLQFSIPSQVKHENCKRTRHEQSHDFLAQLLQKLTEAVLVLKRPVKFYDPGMAGSQLNEGILFDKSRLKFVVAREVALVEDFNRILVFRDSMRRLHDLRGRVSHAVGSCQSALRTVE